MTRDQARRILDQLRTDEADYSPQMIDRALRASGDLTDHEETHWHRPAEGWIDLKRGPE